MGWLAAGPILIMELFVLLHLSFKGLDLFDILRDDGLAGVHQLVAEHGGYLLGHFTLLQVALKLSDYLLLLFLLLNMPLNSLFQCLVLQFKLFGSIDISLDILLLEGRQVQGISRIETGF